MSLLHSPPSQFELSQTSYDWVTTMETVLTKNCRDKLEACHCSSGFRFTGLGVFSFLARCWRERRAITDSLVVVCGRHLPWCVCVRKDPLGRCFSARHRSKTAHIRYILINHFLTLQGCLSTAMLPDWKLESEIEFETWLLQQYFVWHQGWAC